MKFSKILKGCAAVMLALIFCVQLVPLKAHAASIEELLNSAELYPQKTGFRTMDQKVASLLAEFRKTSTSTYELMLAAYDWLVYNVKYDSNLEYYPYYDFDSHYPCPVSFYAVYFGYDPLFEKEGVCDNFSSAYAIIARAIGLDAYIRWGKQHTGRTTYDHMWVEIYLDGVAYIFDPQSDNSVYKSSGKNRHLYFGVPAADSSMYEIRDNNRINNAKLFASFVPVSQTLPVKYCYVRYQAVGNGSVSASPLTAQRSAQLSARSAIFNSHNFAYQFSGWLADTSIASIGTSITLTASANAGEPFRGWYVNGKRVSTSVKYTFHASEDVTVQALFGEQKFTDVPEGKWYHDAVYDCFKYGLMTGTSLTTFSPNDKLTRAMAVTVIGKMANANLSGYSEEATFADVKQGTWYHNSVEWAKENGIASGYSASKFGPNDFVTREQLAVMLWKLAGYFKYGNMLDADLSGFTDADEIHSWALKAMKWACRIGILSGTKDKRLIPRSNATRAETAVMVMRFRKG
ncbi:MAG: S-layer homology domain-containing protein [Clostridia bacterium]|nr:S-layer homology domain-containing protein [Clostridia bacterium]